MQTNKSPFTKDVIAAIVLLYAVAGVILFIQVGPWEAVRQVIINGLIVFAWLWSAEKLLQTTPIPSLAPIRFPTAELIWALAALLIVLSLIANHYGGWLSIPSWVTFVLFYGAVLILFTGLRYPLKDLGFNRPSKSGWLAVLAAILINFAAGALFVFLPSGEAAPLPQSDFANQITGPMSVVILILGIFFRAALPEELLLRVTLQPRLAQFLPLGWAILVQALLFSVGHLPQQLLNYQRPFILALAYVLPINNGLLGGYIWYRTRSLPLLLLLHLFAYSRFGI